MSRFSTRLIEKSSFEILDLNVESEKNDVKKQRRKEKRRERREKKKNYKFEDSLKIEKENEIENQQNLTYNATEKSEMKERKIIKAKRFIKPISDNSLKKICEETYTETNPVTNFETIESIDLDYSLRKSISNRKTSTPKECLNDITFKNENITQISTPAIKFAKKTTPATSKVKKMPNFQKIHQKANEQLEDIHQYSERKAKRAENLLLPSSHKKRSRIQSIDDEHEKPPQRKQLKFSCDAKDLPKSPLYIPLPTTPYPKHKKSASEMKATPKKKEQTPKAIINTVKLTSKIKVQTPTVDETSQKQISIKAQIPVIKTLRKQTPKIRIQTPKVIKKQENVSKIENRPKFLVSKFVPSSFIPVFKGGVVNKNDIFRFTATSSATSAVENSLKTKTNRIEETKAAVNKNRTKITHDAINKNVKEYVRGVRTNRRFDLMMKNRKLNI